jgi:branched-chain amino acid aminotransferase
MFICLNGQFFPQKNPVISSGNSSYRYGDGLFETLRCSQGELQLFKLHMRRLLTGMEQLGYGTPAFFSEALLETKINELLRKNHCLELARVRLSVYRGEGGMFDNDHKTGYIIECWPLQRAAIEWNENGLVIGVYPELKKTMDFLSNLKTASFLIYSLAAQYAKSQRWNDAIVLNTDNGIADTTIANLFIVSNGDVYTPSLEQGCVAGVMRAHVMEALKKQGILVKETKIDLAMLNEADEVFLTNAIRGLRWVQRLENKIYSNGVSRKLYNQLFNS